MKDPLEAVKLKIDRASSHISEVNRLADFLTEPNGYEIVSEIDTEKGEVRKKFRLLREPPAQIGVICGEIMYGLRSALDHLVTAAATRRGIVVIKRTGFPIEETIEKFEDTLNSRRIRQRFPELAEVLSDLKPYKNGGYDGFLWWLHWLNGMEKHQTIVPMVSTFVGWHYDFVLKPLPGFDASKEATIKMPKSWRYLDKDSVTLFVHPVNTEIEGGMDLQLNVAFREIETPHPWGMVDVLSKFVDLTRSIVSIFEDRIFSK